MYRVFKKGMSILLVMLMVMGGISGVVVPSGGTAYAAVSFAGGTGSASDPYQIATADQLDLVRNYLGAGLYFNLTADIDLSSYTNWEPIGTVDNEFMGNMDGNGFEINNLKIDSQGHYYSGLFGFSDGIITNMILDDIEVKGAYTVGGLVAWNYGTISNSYATGSMSGDTAVGGLVGINSGSISNSYATGSMDGFFYVGGLVGENYHGSISNSYATGSVSRNRYLGGLVGYNEGPISNSYATGSVIGNNDMGGLVGYNTTTINHSFYDSNTTGQLDTGNSTGKTTEEMQNSSTFSDWDFSEDWYMLSGQYPKLWAFTALKPGTNAGTTKLTGVTSGMEYKVNTGSYTTIIDTSVDNIVVELGDMIYVRVKETTNQQESAEQIRSVDAQDIKILPIPTGAIAGVIAPITGATPVTAVTYSAAYTASIDWSPVDAIFAGGEIYTATITLTPKRGYTLTGVGKDSFAVAGATTTNAADSGVVTAEFPATAAPIQLGAIAGVTAPAIGATPVTAVTYSAEYTATVSWSPTATLFVPETAYTATITITPKAGYTLTRVPANFFTIAGATTTNAADSGVVTAEFPATAVLPVTEVPVTTIPIATAGIAGVEAPVTGAIPVTTVTYSPEYTATVSWSPTTTLFAQGIAYTATISIIPKAGYTLTGVPANFFNVAGATTTNEANSGVVSAVFSATQPVSTGSTSTTPSNSIATSTKGTLTLPVNQAGEVSFEDAVKITIPVGAINKELILSIHKVLDTPILFANKEILLSPVYEITKNFAEDFSKPITMNFTFDSTLVKSNQKAAVFYYDEVKKSWVEVAGSKIEGNHIIVEVNHLGKYAVLSVDGVTGLPVTEPVTGTSTKINLSDVAGHWAEANIQQALSIGMVKGYLDGTFQPNRTVTRAEFAVMLMNVLKPQGAGTQLTFTDTATIGAWAQTAVAQALQAGIITGYEDGTFRPNTEITRAEMAVILAKALGKSTEVKLTTSFVDDKNIPAWAKASVDFVKKSGMVQGKGDNEFAPQASATRAEAVTVLLKLLAQRSN
ncbi:S-layer homology domain-containing protein [Paenibacillus monticola]|uniref:SLH domain-containing protein n=1 Tax=Paenibacillus monticola TaxID=2666075 RepID=A0A7X2H3W5_9BACL|nr:S-layer homology domain-containing protein [Paenibacillus monticola]MRN53029.1 hypothetical protein [Paenibacillus monticola]